MFGLGKGDKDKERFWNMMMTRGMYATDEELYKIAPWVLIPSIVIAILLWIFL